MQVDHQFEENLDPERIDAIIERLRSTPAQPKKAEAVPSVKGDKVPEGTRPRGKRTQA